MNAAERQEALRKVVDAADYAAEMHRAQRRKADDSPYINHPLAVANLVAKHAESDNELVCYAAAILHDVVEDTDATLKDVRERFGDAIADVVAEVTDDRSLPAAERKRQQIEHMRHISASAAKVKLADKLHNLTDLTHNPPPKWSLERIQGYFVWSKAVVGACPHEHAGLRGELDKVFAGKVQYQGQEYDAVPKDCDLEVFVEDYYKSL